jgi:hypothetical protein
MLERRAAMNRRSGGVSIRVIMLTMSANNAKHVNKA